MTVFFRSLCSSSSGNCLKLWTEETTILIDCGIKAQYRCHDLLDEHVGNVDRLGAVLVTHSHGDHIGYPALRALADRGVCLRAHKQVFRHVAGAGTALEVEIRDANDLLGREGAVIVIRRIDQSSSL